MVVWCRGGRRPRGRGNRVSIRLIVDSQSRFTQRGFWFQSHEGRRNRRLSNRRLSVNGPRLHTPDKMARVGGKQLA